MNKIKTASRSGSRGFTLPAVLVIVGALLILAVGILAVTGIERRTARSYVDLQRAEMIARAGLEDVKGTLKATTDNDDYVILQGTREEVTEKGKTPAPNLLLARGTARGGSLSYSYTPLFSSTKPVVESQAPALVVPKIDDLTGSAGKDYIDFETLPYQDKVRTAWINMYDSKDRVIGRYAYWIEDLQGKIDAKNAGNANGPGGTFVASEYSFPAPGLNPEPDAENQPNLNQISLNAIDPASTVDKPGSLGKVLIENRSMLLSPGAILAATEMKPPLARDKITGRIDDKKNRAIEESLSATVQSYEEQPVVPFAPGINPDYSGKPKLNLNDLLNKGERGVEEMGSFIDEVLPRFTSTRKGGFPEDYSRTLAANAIDYADDDPAPLISEGVYRGLDGYPLVSEFAMKTRWEDARTENGRKIIELSVTLYAELWNMSNQQIIGRDIQLSHETKYRASVGVNPNGVNFSQLQFATPRPQEHNGYSWVRPVKVNGVEIANYSTASVHPEIVLNPNDYKLITFEKILYKFDVGPSSFYISSPVSMFGEEYGATQAGYRLWWNGKIVDKSRGHVHRNSSSLTFPEAASATTALSRKVRMTVPGHSYNYGSGFINNMGDPRMSYYLMAPQDANSYPGNYSPARRNIRWGTVYSGDTPTKGLIYGRVMPSEWPDGGHNSIYGNNNFASLVVEKTEPDDLRYFSGLPQGKEEEAPMRFSAYTKKYGLEQRFYSATELGRIYDPVMWQVDPAVPGSRWGDILRDTKMSSIYGGGNTLRIGRPEHPKFNTPETHAARLLDLFHAGISRSEDKDKREGRVVKIDGNVNINTASRDALRALAAGYLKMDKITAIRTSETHSLGTRMAPPVTLTQFSAPMINEQADKIADAIIRCRPYASPSELAGAVDKDGKYSIFNPGQGNADEEVLSGRINVFGNRAMYAENNKIEWADSAAEEVFARVYEASTVRSRNFRIWVVGQSLSPGAKNSTNPEVLAEVRRAYTVFTDPGKRNSDGSIDKDKLKITVTHESTF